MTNVLSFFDELLDFYVLLSGTQFLTGILVVALFTGMVNLFRYFLRGF